MKVVTMSDLPLIDKIVWALDANLSIGLSNGKSIELIHNQEYDKNLFLGDNWLYDSVVRGYWAYDETKPQTFKQIGDKQAKDSLAEQAKTT